jgi:hypothetical protein
MISMTLVFLGSELQQSTVLRKHAADTSLAALLSMQKLISADLCIWMTLPGT